ncbi:hypothetical protein PR003_g21738 [Phytophthora rubi]|uniref:Ubiquitin-like protease family profile domain-containing protein n=1 Tax=Phytophthora rubi TaxID=129364 RepID=A0A6A3JEL9_9STRA|nr:hypothetical protein PR001_g20875 [Phytophthora rubi]KAE9304506.1 hypothetical protein PR003_g21738 [Phytophthora rubi]
MDDFSLKIGDVRGPAEIRLLQPCQAGPEVTRMLPLETIEEAKASIPYDIEDSRTYLVFYEEFGYIKEEQLLIMKCIFTVKNCLRDIGFVLDWIEVVTWNEAQLQRVNEPFGDEHMSSKADRKGALMSMSLGMKYVDAEATSCASLLAYREDLWLNLSCMITGMLFLRHGYTGVGVVNPSFYHEKQPADKIRIASAFKPFEASNRRVIGVLNVTGAHWIAFMINRDTHICYTFDPQQGNVKNMANALRETIEPLLHMKIPLSYEAVKSCRQRDGSSCGVLCLTMLELLLSDQPWVNDLYDLIPYLRLRYLNKSIGLLTQASDKRGERL